MIEVDVSNILLPLARTLGISVKEIELLHGTKDLFDPTSGINHISGIDIEIPYKYLSNLTEAYPDAQVKTIGRVTRFKVMSKVSVFIIRHLEFKEDPNQDDLRRETL